MPTPPSGGLAATALAAGSSPSAPAAPVLSPYTVSAHLATSDAELPSVPWAYGPPAAPAAASVAAPSFGAHPSQMAPSWDAPGRPVVVASHQSGGIQANRPPEKIGVGWTQEQWFLKALEIAEAIVEGKEVSDLGKAPSCQAPEPLPEHKYSPKQTSPPASRIVRVVDGVEENLIAAVEQEGFDVIPDWYGALDRIYALTDMAKCKEKPEPFVGDGNRAGVPGYSFLIKSSNQSSGVFSPAEEEARAKAHEALIERYQNRLLVTSLR